MITTLGNTPYNGYAEGAVGILKKGIESSHCPVSSLQNMLLIVICKILISYLLFSYLKVYLNLKNLKYKN